MAAVDKENRVVIEGNHIALPIEGSNCIFDLIFIEELVGNA
jgi:hypothetical protein